VDINALKTGLYSLLTGSSNPFITACPRVFFVDDVTDVDTVTYPYTDYQFTPGKYEFDSGTDYVTANIQFSIFDAVGGSSLNVGSIGTKLDTLLNNSEHSLSVSGYKVLNVKRLNPPIEHITMSEHWMETRDYKIELQKL